MYVKKTYNSTGGLVETVYYWSQNFITVVNASGSYNFTYVYHNGDLVAQQNPDSSKPFICPHFIIRISHFIIENFIYSILNPNK